MTLIIQQTFFLQCKNIEIRSNLIEWNFFLSLLFLFISFNNIHTQTFRLIIIRWFYFFFVFGDCSHCSQYILTKLPYKFNCKPIFNFTFLFSFNSFTTLSLFYVLFILGSPIFLLSFFCHDEWMRGKITVMDINVCCCCHLTKTTKCVMCVCGRSLHIRVSHAFFNTADFFLLKTFDLIDDDLEQQHVFYVCFVLKVSIL